MKTICLSMIVKNESKIIERMLESVRRVIDKFCIVDTGSTDDTVEVIRAFAAKHALPGVVVHDPFVNFEVSRTKALAEARQFKTDYILLMDADMVLEINGFDRSELKCDVHLLYQGSPSLQYLNARLVSSALDCRYKGVTHEYLDIQGPHTSGNLTTIRIHDLGDGGAKADKFTRDIRLLTEGLVTEPGNLRYHFYLANSYFDSGNTDKAVECYLTRVKLGGWSEEVFYSLYRLCLCYKRLNNVDLFLLYGLKAWLAVPTRAESVYELVKHYREVGNQKMAYSLYLLVKDLPPPPQGLFVHMDVYRYKLHYEFSILAYYCASKTHVFRQFQHLFIERDMDLHNLFGNYKFYVPHPAPFQTMDLSCTHTIEGVEFCGSSPSIVATGHTYVVNVRLVNYKLTAGNYEVPRNQLVTRNKRVNLDSNLQETTAALVDVVDEVRQPKSHACTWYGVEDVKLVTVGTTIYFTGTKCLASEQIGVCWGEYAPTLVPAELRPEQACEKNWVFLPGKLEMIYSWAPLRFGPIRDGVLQLTGTRPMPHLFNMARGSCNGVEWKGEYWFVVHFMHKQGQDPRHYYHAIAVFDPEMNLRRYTLPFKFRAESVEYCLGMVVEESRILFTHSANDASPQLCAYRHGEFEFVNN